MQNGESLVLGIESSCDDTGVAVVRASDGAILGQAITGQVRLPCSAQHNRQPADYPALVVPLYVLVNAQSTANTAVGSFRLGLM